MIRSGYAGKIQIGVIFCIVKEAVDHLRAVSPLCGAKIDGRSHMIKYTPIEATRAKPASTQNSTKTALLSQGPAWLGPY